ncbi:MAG TPA: KorB domain-containing protein [Gaiellaceae bacterium]|nr:KorB domain-containing protein [Gaiellaceae bacterium]
MRLELHQLDQKYASLRAREPAREQRLLVSLGEHGQQTPVWVTATEEAGRWVLIDGYARVRALRALARDWADARVMEVPEAEALLRSFGLDNTRPRSALEEGWMLRSLRDEHGLKQQELATRLDRSESWVSRRLDLVRVLPASVQEAVQKGRFSAKAAERVLVPLARAKPAQCEKLVKGLMPQGASARELLRIYEAWKRSTPEQRERIAGAPRLFLQAEAATREAERAAKVEEPAKGLDELALLLRDLATIASVCARQSGRLAITRPVPKDWKDERRLFGGWTRARAAFAALAAHLEDVDRGGQGSDEWDGPLEEERSPCSSAR